jgi:hypothetical protein
VVAVSSVLFARTIYPPWIHKHLNYLQCRLSLERISLAISFYAMDKNGQYPDRLEAMILDQDLDDAYVLTCRISGDEWILEREPGKAAAALAQPGEVSFLYFGRGFNSATVAPRTLIACDKPHNHDHDEYDLWAVFADGTIQAIPRVRLERMITARMATAPSTRSIKRRAATTTMGQR